MELRGLMGMAPFGPDPEQARPYFQTVARDCTRNCPPQCRQVLSMGMTGDFEIAIEEGATHVRIGTAIFGSRIGHLRRNHKPNQRFIYVAHHKQVEHPT